MPREREDVSLLWDMLEAARKIRQFVAGEAARGVTDEYQREHAEVPWRGIISQRHFLAHEYGEVRQERLWRVATVRIPELIEQLERLVPPAP